MAPLHLTEEIFRLLLMISVQMSVLLPPQRPSLRIRVRGASKKGLVNAVIYPFTLNKYPANCKVACCRSRLTPCYELLA